MQFALPREVYGDAAATLDHLDRLLLRVIDEVHSLTIDDADALEASGWFAEQRPHRREFLRQIVTASAFTPARNVVKIGADLPLGAAVRLAYQPLSIGVEDETFDWILVEAAVRAYGDPETLRLWGCNPPAGPAVRPAHGGGTGNLMKKIERAIEEAREMGIPVRMVVVTDSDRQHPDDRSAKADAIEQLCASHGIPSVVLGCRSAENYIPNEALQRWSSGVDRVAARPQVAALLRLSVAQRDHFPMKAKKHAARKALAADAPAEVAALFANVTVEDRAVLVGFQDDIIRLLSDHLPAPATAEFDRRDHRGDLRKLVAYIAEAL